MTGTCRDSFAQRFGTTIVVAGGVAIGLAWLAILFLWFHRFDVVDGALVYRSAWAIDYFAYLEAAQRLAGEGSLYDPAMVAGAFEPGVNGLFYYAPPLGVALLPATGVSADTGSVIWFGLHVLALLAACALMPVKVPVRVLAFVVAAISLPVFKDIVYGNVSTLLLLPLVVAWRWLDRPTGSVALALAMSVRPGLGLFLLWQVLRRQWRAFAWTIGAGLALVALSLPFIGVGGIGDYAAVLRNLRLPSGLSENHALGAVAMEMGAPDTFVTLVWIATIAVAIGAIVLARRGDREVGFMVTLCASMIAVPLLWDHHTASLLLPAALLANRLRPVLLLLPLATWLPALAPFVVLATLGLLLWRGAPATSRAVARPIAG